jgi:hypothetical protein
MMGVFTLPRVMPLIVGGVCPDSLRQKYLAKSDLAELFIYYQ